MSSEEARSENNLLKELEKTACIRIQAAESQHKSAKAGLMTAEYQVRELKAKYDKEFNKVYELHIENQKILPDLEAIQAEVKKAKDSGQVYYDQGFEEAIESLKSQLAEECNSCFLQGWDLAVDQVEVDDASDLYNKGRKFQPYKVAPTKESDEMVTEDLQDLEHVQVEGVHEGVDGTNKDDNVEVIT